MPFLERAGVRIFYEAQGEGPPVLLTHGYSATSQMWSAQVDTFKERYRLIVWDMRGHGRTDYPEEQAAYSEAHTVADMAAVLDACGVERAVIAGLSLGGYSTLAFHLAHRERVRAMMLFDTGPGFKKDEAREAWNERAQKRAADLEAQGLAARGESDEVKLSTHRSADGLARAARGMLTQKDARIIQSLETVAVPTLVLAGADDTPFLAATDYMVHKIPGARKVIVPDAGHASNLHQPGAFNEAMGSFLDALPA